MGNFFRNLWDTNYREINRLLPIVEQINELESDNEDLSDDELRGKTEEFKARYAQGETLDELLPEAFAVVREAAKRVLGQRHYDVQLMGGMILHDGKIAEMKTGEGKTLVATLPCYLNALSGQGVHVVTVNDYLARRDSEWMGRVYRFLGLKVGVILHHLDSAQRREAYGADITYGTNNEFGFDYLRDNMAGTASDMVQRELNFAIVDEVDSILIDEARTPLIISGQAEESTSLYQQFARIAPRLRKEEDYTVDEKAHTVAVTEEGVAKVEKMIGVENMYDPSHTDLVHQLTQALKAKELMKRDRDYVVKDGEVIIVDEFTGRLMFGRRFSEGLHQAIEAKENVKVERESQTLATITFQNYFRMYNKLAGMTGTAETEEAEFRKIYSLPVVVVPTHVPMARIDHPDVIYKTVKSKFHAVVDEIVRIHATGQPVLVGTISIEKSEYLSEQLKRRGVPHQVLNAKYHEKEAEIIAQAGRYGTVTIATNMAGRGTDIILGGNAEQMAKGLLRSRGIDPAEATQEEWDLVYREAKAVTDEEHQKVVECGGLYILGTERHESRRIDNQLRGRSGRQGDAGSSRFFVAMEDDLMRLFGGEMIVRWMERLGWEEDMPIEHPRIAKSIESAQRKVEMRNFDIRKHVLDYDDVLNKQRQTIYDLRKALLLGEDVHEQVLEYMEETVDRFLEETAGDRVHPDEWDMETLVHRVESTFLPPETLDVETLQSLTKEEIRNELLNKTIQLYEEKKERIGEELMGRIERDVMLGTIDRLWMEHLENMDDLREGISLRAYGQNDPLIAYKIEAYQMFQGIMYALAEEVIRILTQFEFSMEEPREERPRRRLRNISTNLDENGEVAVQQRTVGKKVGRNDPCPCGSGKKYKKCCGANE